MQIGEILKVLMERHGMTYAEVARRVREAGASTTTYQSIQGIVNNPNRRPRILPELAAAFGMTVEQFLAYRPNGESTPLPNVTRPSQTLRLSGQKLALAYQLARLTHSALGLSFNPETPKDAEIIALAYHYLLRRSADSVTVDNLAEFATEVRTASIQQGQLNDSAGKPK